MISGFASRWQDLVAAIRLRPVRLGLLGTCLLVLGSMSPAYLPQASPFWPAMRALGLDNEIARVAATAMTIGAVGLLIWAWYQLRPAVYADAKPWAILCWWALPLLLAPPIFSHDAYSYAAQGWLIHNNLNPYEVSPSVQPGTFADQVAWLWRYTPAPYGPLALTIAHWLDMLAGFNPYYSAVAQRIPALFGVALLVYCLPRIALLLDLDPRQTAWFSAINPLLVIDLIGGAHNDALMLGFVAFAIWLAYRGWHWPAVVVVGVGMAVKQPALLAAIPVAVVGSGWESWRWRAVVRCLPRAFLTLLGALAVFTAISFATGLGFGWLNAVSVPGMIITLAPFSLIGWVLQQVFLFFGMDAAAAAIIPLLQSVSLGIAAALMAWAGVKYGRTEPVTFLAWAYLAFAVFGPALHTWYLLWGALFLPLAKVSERILRTAAAVTSVLLVYGASNLAWRNNAVALAVAAVAAASVWIILRRRAHAVMVSKEEARA